MKMPDFSDVLLVTDLDGTLLPENKILSVKDKEAIKRFRSDGGRFTVATGRTVQSADRYIKELEVDIPVILYNGSLIYDVKTGESLFTDELPACASEIAKELFGFMKDPGGEVLRLDNIYVVCNNEYEKEHIKICDVDVVLSELDKIPEGGWFKILFATEPELITELEEYISRKDYGVDFVRSHDTFIEMLPRGSSKGAALKEYRKTVKTNCSRIIAAGDYHNDIEMLLEADIGVATANAQQAVKDSADVVLRCTSSENAIAELIGMIYEGRI
ncbi:MAG: HAD family hydrolase [Porcipelethomonas sp.]